MLNKYNIFQPEITKKKKKFPQRLTEGPPIGGNPPTLGIEPINGLVTGDGARAPFGWPQLWSTKRVFISGLGFGFLQSWCCQFKLQSKEEV